MARTELIEKYCFALKRREEPRQILDRFWRFKTSFTNSFFLLSEEICYKFIYKKVAYKESMTEMLNDQTEAFCIEPSVDICNNSY